MPFDSNFPSAAPYAPPVIGHRSAEPNRLNLAPRLAALCQGVSNNAVSCIARFTLTTLALTSSLGLLVFTKRLIAATIFLISSPPPISDDDAELLKGKILGTGIFIGMLGGGSAGAIMAYGLVTCGAIFGLDTTVRQRDFVISGAALGFFIGILMGAAYASYVEVEPETIIIK